MEKINKERYAGINCHVNELATADKKLVEGNILNLIFIYIPLGAMLNAYDNFTLNSIFRPKAFIKKNMKFNINYIIPVPSFCTCFY